MGLFRRNRIEHDAQGERKVAETELEANEASRGGVYLFFLVMFAVGFLVPFLLTFAFVSPLTIAASAAVGFVVATSVRIAPQWERVAVLRFGRFNRIAGPGIYCCIPFAEYAAIHVDQRIMTASFSAEAALTADLVPVDVDAILFWMVWDAEKACLEVENYPKAVLRSAQTAMRDVIGQLNLADISMRRKQIDRDLEEILGKKCEQWGVHQGFPHCAIFPTAASRRSLGRVSVPMWPFTLSSRLLIVALVSRYLTNQLIRRGSILYHRSFYPCTMRCCGLMRY